MNHYSDCCVNTSFPLSYFAGQQIYRNDSQIKYIATGKKSPSKGANNLSTTKRKQKQNHFARKAFVANAKIPQQTNKNIQIASTE